MVWAMKPVECCVYLINQHMIVQVRLPRKKWPKTKREKESDHFRHWPVAPKVLALPIRVHQNPAWVVAMGLPATARIKLEYFDIKDLCGTLYQKKCDHHIVNDAIRCADMEKNVKVRLINGKT